MNSELTIKPATTKKILIGLGVVLAIFVAYMAGSGGRTEVEEPKPTTTDSSSIVVRDRPVETAPAPEPSNSFYRSVFVSGCTEEGTTSQAACECMYDHMERKHGIEGMVALASDEAGMNEAALDAAVNCMDEL